MMVSRGRRTRISDAELRQRIARQLADDKDISAREIARRLRAGGISVSHDRVRTITRLERAIIKGLSDVTLQAFGVEYDLLDFANPRQLAEAIYRQNPTDIAYRVATSVAVDYTVRVTYTAIRYGTADDSRTITLDGRIVQPLTDYRRDLVEKRIEDQLIGRIENLEFNDTDPEGMDIVIEHLDVVIRTLTLGGDRRRR